MSKIKITTRDGRVIETHEIEFNGYEIRCIPLNDPEKRELCGVYKDRIRATAIFAEMTCMGWNDENPEYVMPKE